MTKEKSRGKSAQEARAASKKAAIADSPVIDSIVSSLCRGGARLNAIKAREIKNRSVTEAEWNAMVEVAHGLINRASAYDAVAEYGKAKLFFEELIQRAMDQGDIKIALDAEKEKIKLLGLAEQRNSRAVEDSYQSAVEQMIRSHLEPLGIAPAGTEIVELARRVAVWFCDHFTELRKTKRAAAKKLRKA